MKKLKNDKRDMKRGKLKKRSKNKATLDKADRSLQDAHRRRFKGRPCEVCGHPFQVIHHHLEKSKSNVGRFKHPTNYIFLCHHCHSLIIFRDNHIVAKYSIKRGKKWEKKIDALKLIHRQSFSKGELEKIIEYYSKWKISSKYQDSEISF